MKLSQSVRPISYLKAHASEIISDVTLTHKTMVITQRGQAKVIVQDMVSYEQTQDSLALLKILAVSGSNLANGKVKPIKQAFSDITARIKEKQ